jgi:UDP-glucose 4-epimerase
MCAFCGLDAAFERDGFFSITGDGTQTRDWVHVDDIARAFEVALFSDVKGDTVDVCTGIQTSMSDLASMLDVPVKYTDPRPGDAKELISDPTQMEATFGFEATEKIEDRIWDAFPAVAKARGRV